MDFIFGKNIVVDGKNDVEKAKNFIDQIQLVHQQVQEYLEKIWAKYKARCDKHQVYHDFQVGDQVWLYISKKILQGEGKNINPIRYGPFKILENIGNNAFWLDFPPYMQIYSIVNAKILRLYEPPMIVDQEDNVQIQYIEDFSPKYSI